MGDSTALKILIAEEAESLSDEALNNLFQRPKADAPLSLILKLVGETCNLDCVYCYEKRKPYDGTRILSPDLVKSFLATLGSGKPLSIELHGGEPLLFPKDKMRELLGVLRSYGGPISLHLQTNGTLITDEWLDLFKKQWPEIQLGISLDGDEEANNNRIKLSGAGSWRDTQRGLQQLEDRGFQVGIIAVVTRSSLGRAAEIINDISSFDCVKIIKFAPCFDLNVRQETGPTRTPQTLKLMSKSIDGSMPWAITPAEYTEFLISAWTHWRINRLFTRFLLEPLVGLMRKLYGVGTTDCHFSNKKCSHVITLYPDGTVGSCDELGRRESFLTTIKGLTRNPAISTHWDTSKLPPLITPLIEKCSKCNYQASCGGGCLATRIRLQKVGLENAYCDSRMQIIDFVVSELGLNEK